jgi:predicted Fe-Mo cluster-binding NifX family protein
MRILLSAFGTDWDATIAPAFDTAPNYLIVDTEKDTCDACIHSSITTFNDLNIDAVITGHMMTETVSKAIEKDIKLYTIPAGGIKIAVKQCVNGKLKAIKL